MNPRAAMVVGTGPEHITVQAQGDEYDEVFSKK